MNNKPHLVRAASTDNMPRAQSHMQGPGVVREFVISEKTGTPSHMISFYALAQFLSIRTENAAANLANVVDAYSRCPRLTARKVQVLGADALWLVEAPVNEA